MRSPACAGLLETGEGIATAPTGGPAGRAADLALFHILADIVLRRVVVQCNLGVIERPQQFGAGAMQAHGCAIEALKAGLGVHSASKRVSISACTAVFGSALQSLNA